jgi:ketosteroid isomerase-like protein
MAGDVAIFTHAVETVISSAGETITQRERETIVFRRENGHWIAFHEHLSVLPA